MKVELENALIMAEAFSKLLHPFAEVVIHDLEKDCIEAIFNPFSQRQVGDASYLDSWDFPVDPQQDVIGPYQKLNYDGRTLKSISIVLRDSSGKAQGFLCVNMDVSVFERYQQSLQLFLGNNDPSTTQTYEGLFKEDLYEQINIYVQQYCREHQLNLETLTRPQKRELMSELKAKGAFNGKNATTYVARVLGVSRATVYNYLKEV